MFVYKDHQCRIEYDREWVTVRGGLREEKKAWYIVRKPNGQELYADISPDNDDEELMKMWIDAGYPERLVKAPLDRSDLEFLLKQWGNEVCQS